MIIYLDGQETKHVKRMNLEIPTNYIRVEPSDAITIDDLRIYSIPLNAKQILELYERVP